MTPDIPFYSIFDYEQTLPFYLKHTFILVQFEDEMAFGIRQEPQKVIAKFSDFAPAWRAQPKALAIIPAQFFSHLQNLGIEMTEIYRDTQYVVVKKP